MQDHEHNVCMSPEMESFLNQSAQNRGLRGTSQDLNTLAHIIIKDVKADRRLQVLTITRRLLYCCPIENSSDGVGV